MERLDPAGVPAPLRRPQLVRHPRLVLQGPAQRYRPQWAGLSVARRAHYTYTTPHRAQLARWCGVVLAARGTSAALARWSRLWSRRRRPATTHTAATALASPLLHPPSPPPPTTPALGFREWAAAVYAPGVVLAGTLFTAASSLCTHNPAFFARAWARAYHSLRSTIATPKHARCCLTPCVPAVVRVPGLLLVQQRLRHRVRQVRRRDRYGDLLPVGALRREQGAPRTRQR